MFKTKNSSKRARTYRGTIVLPPAVLAALGQVNVDGATINDPYITNDDLVVINTTDHLPGVTYDVTLVGGNGSFHVAATVTNVTGAQLNFPGNGIKWGIFPT